MPDIIGLIRGKYDEFGGATFFGQALDIERPTYDGIGRAQEFEQGTISWHPDLGAFAVYGAIRAQWIALGREQYGYPVTDEVGTPDGRGRFNQFKALPSGEDRAIYWTQDTGVHEVFGAIYQSWAWYGFETSMLGYPTSGELSTHDGVGRFQSFENGVIVWRGDLGAFESHGAINGRYLELGGSAWAYPTSDELVCHDGVGRFQVFEGNKLIVWHPEIGAWEVEGDFFTVYGQVGGSAFGYPLFPVTDVGDGRGRYQHFRQMDVEGQPWTSILWTPDYGAHEIYGAIRGYWEELGNEAGMGYPKTGELATHDGVGRFQEFEYGLMVWHPEIGVHVVWGDILKRYLELGGTAFGYPITDESIAADERGRYNHFQQMDVEGRPYVSIYWTPEYGAHEIFGYIRNHWGDLGWEKSLLGYPTSGELVCGDGVGRFQVFEYGQIVWHPDLGAFEVHGDILTRYGELGGSNWAYPVTDELGCPDGRGRANHFRQMHVEGGPWTSIYWTPEHGAHETFGAIRNHWADLGWEQSVIGYPMSEEFVCPDTVGRFQNFESGQMVWHPDLGAFEIHGDILTRYTDLGGSNWGYPTSDQRTPADGRSRFNHFRQMPENTSKSIYWTPEHGAVEIYGAIRGKWSDTGWSKSYLGYPMFPEGDWPEGPGRWQAFENGRIYYRSDIDVAAADPLELFHDIRLSGSIDAIGGWVKARLHSDGWVQLVGEMTNTGAEAYDFRIHLLVRNNAWGMSAQWTGDAGVDYPIFGGDNDDEWDEWVEVPHVRDHFFEIQDVHTEVDWEHSGAITDALDDIVEGIVGWLAGSLVITPGVGMFLFVGTELASLIATGGFNAGSQIIGGTMMLMGPAGTAFAIAADALAHLGSDERYLNDEERRIAEYVFKGSIDYGDVKVTDTLGGGGRAFTYPNFLGNTHLNMGSTSDRALLDYGLDDGDVVGQVMIHELTHAWQLQRSTDKSYVGAGLMARMREATGEDVYNIDEEDLDWDAYELEEQATLVELWFIDNYMNTTDPATPPTAENDWGLNTPNAWNHKYFRYIRDNIREGHNP